MRLALGTVQFGLDYGISNKNGRPSYSEVERILHLANTENIKVLDTALGYGESHHSLATYEPLHSQFSIVTKLPPLHADIFSQTDIERYIRYVEQCFIDLKCTSLKALLFHQASDAFKPGVKALLDYLKEQKNTHRIQQLGVSVYSDTPASLLCESSFIDLVQLPFNAFDDYFKKTGVLKALASHGVEIHSRSCFLQGLLLMPIEQLTPYFRPWFTQLTMFHKQAKHHNVSLLTLCLAYVAKEPEINQILVGVNSERELTEILEAYQKVATIDPTELINMAVDDPKLTNPALWNK
ncbi:aldo/keto reductase [Pseudoalteromonas sp. JBTF-M23]|uniref:Aldo/keto reductase n=1 Tax=Pseudoalteromonas caenipelagi TaxID=2726988 RepID=A0A849VGF2_9GAMM|nr:aldo/keto reductase [Pseudoalteromonas caenipelagi]NOU50791.1 aldo/keto reductase [Pseudoalteromonas caenipelagi]